MKQYHDLCRLILDKGKKKDDRTGTGTISTFGYQMRFNLADGFPLITTKKMHLKAIIHELLWFLEGNTNVFDLQARGVKIWDADYNRVEKAGTHSNGDLGPIYGRQWRSWEVRKPLGKHAAHITYIDQISQVIEQIKSNSDSRRLIVNAWNVGEIDEMALPPCHVLFQFYVANNKLSCQLYQRSGDVFLGVPFNIASYALLTMMIAQVCGLELGEFVHTLGDAHIYLNHIEQINLQLTREPRKLPIMKINKAKDIFSYKYNDFKLEGYDPHPPIKGNVSVGE